MTLEPINLEDKTVTPTKEQLVVISDTADGLNSVTVEPIPDEYIKPTGTKEIVANGDYDISQFANVQVAVGGITKGLVINSCDSDGYVTDASIVGMLTIPMRYLNNVLNTSGIFSKIGANLHLEETIEEIYAYAFSGCYAWSLSKIPDACLNIATYSFQNIGSKSIVIPNATKIGGQAFYNSSLEEVDLQTLALCDISSQAFASCRALKRFIVRSSNPHTISNNIFQNTPIASGTGYIYVPDDAVETYKSATNWSVYADQIKGISELEG